MTEPTIDLDAILKPYLTDAGDIGDMVTREDAKKAMQEAISKVLAGERKTYLITYELEVGIDWSYATEIKSFTKTFDFDKQELKDWMERNASFNKKFKVIDVKIL